MSENKSLRKVELYAMCSGPTLWTMKLETNLWIGCRTEVEAAPTTLGDIIRFAAINNFLQTNGLLTLIRAHEVQFEGFKTYIWQGSAFPQVITLFSAPNHCGCHFNNGAVIKLLVG